ncbi:transposase [Jatrophihabitans lederbergiae]|uniref:Transposase n=1 Tax=Jatrophihabitans lederbergiae TaxID=3075547 RepID=A0ABU2JGW0_9ACTN|nr:transposase [Jatrophihabitans sp. DSM 44399]MDT0264225.1 transposase [Jatrophihabitans sp. DSM 44399]
MGARGYPAEFRPKVLDLPEAGRSIADVAHDLDISEQSIYTWGARTTSTKVWSRVCHQPQSVR